MNKFTPLCILLLSAIRVFSQNTKTDGEREDENIIDTAKVIFFLEDKRATALETLHETLVDSTLVCIGGQLIDYKDAIFRYGEKARNGIMIFKNAQNEENTSSNH